MIQFKLIYRCFNFHSNLFMFCNSNYQSLASIASLLCVPCVQRVEPFARRFLSFCLTAVKHDAIGNDFIFGQDRICFTHIHDGTPCNPLPLSTNQTSVQSVIQNIWFRDIFQDFQKICTQISIFSSFIKIIDELLQLHQLSQSIFFLFRIKYFSTFRCLFPQSFLDSICDL